MSGQRAGEARVIAAARELRDAWPDLVDECSLCGEPDIAHEGKHDPDCPIGELFAALDEASHA